MWALGNSPSAVLQGGAETFIQSFTAIVGVTVAFYFGASAAVQIQALKGSGKQESDQQTDA